MCADGWPVDGGFDVDRYAAEVRPLERLTATPLAALLSGLGPCPRVPYRLRCEELVVFAKRGRRDAELVAAAIEYRNQLAHQRADPEATPDRLRQAFLGVLDAWGEGGVVPVGAVVQAEGLNKRGKEFTTCRDENGTVIKIRGDGHSVRRGDSVLLAAGLGDHRADWLEQLPEGHAWRDPPLRRPSAPGLLDER